MRGRPDASVHAICGPTARWSGLKALRLPSKVEIWQRAPTRSMRACRSPWSLMRYTAIGVANSSTTSSAQEPGVWLIA